MSATLISNQDTAELRELVKRGMQGDQEVLPALKKWLDANPDVWQTYGDMAHEAEQAWIGLAGSPDLCLKESIQRQVEKLKTDLLQGSANPLEKLLVDRIAVCWIQVHYCDISLAHQKGLGLSDYELKPASCLLDHANKRYINAIKQLALVRKLLPAKVLPVETASPGKDKRKAGKSVDKATALRLAAH